MGFFETLAQGYKIMFEDAKVCWKKHGAQILTSSGTGLMLIANALMIKKATKNEVHQAILDANKAIDEIKNTPVTTNNISGKAKKRFMLMKARGKKIISVGKHFWKESLVSIGGAAAVGMGQHINTVQKTMLATGIAAISADFAAYRAEVVADQGKSKDLEYLTGNKRRKKASESEHSDEIEQKIDKDGYFVDENGITIKKDPSAFKFWFSPETCPSLYSDNLFLTIKRLEWVENNLTMKGRTIGHIYLNDMRREFGGYFPSKMDHPLGGLFGKIFDKNDKNGMKTFELGGWRDDVDFMEGRKVGTWIIFPCDPEPIFTKVNRKILAVEDPVN